VMVIVTGHGVMTLVMKVTQSARAEVWKGG
jgi:hypothetical protein